MKKLGPSPLAWPSINLVVRRMAGTTLAFLCLGFGTLKAAGASLEIAVRPTFDGQPLLLDSLRYSNAAQETLSFTRLSYLLSGFALEREDGGWVELPSQFAWMDAEKRRSVARLDHIPEGKYRALRFYLGPDEEANAADPANYPPDHPLNPNLNGLHWSWQGGYIFLAAEGHFRAGSDEIKGYAFHLARDPNRTRINLTAQLDLTHGCAVLLDFDLATLLNAPRPISLAKDGVATHSREGDPVAAALVANLPAAFRVRQVLSATPAISQRSAVQPLYLPEKYTPYRFTMGATFPIPDLPRDNPLLEERVALGKKLFSETALSSDGTLSCASCHAPAAGFTDARRFSLGVRGQTGTRHAMPLFNLAWKTSFFWDGRAPSLRAQALVPIQDPTEMGETLDHVTAKLAGAKDYAPLFLAAFGNSEITAEKIGLALENYLLTLTAHHAKFDRVLRGQDAFSAEERRGFELFMTEYDPRTQQFGADCFHCHGGALFSDHQFHNNGLAENGNDPGRFRFTKSESDRNKFATPSLRNVARSSPYMHDGRFTTLEEVIDHYSTGVQRSATLDPNLAKHPDGGLHLSAEDRRALVAFLGTLSDEAGNP
jgi:cytochrome c peroxidase